MTTAKVYQAISDVTNKIGQQGISKDRENKQQGYSFRGIDDVFNALSPLLSSSKLCILPCVLDRHCAERQTAKGGTLFYVTVKVRFDFVSAEDGSKHEVITYGEAMDSGDKATNKAMSAAYKYAAMQAFCIPTEGDNDADSTTHDLVIPEKRMLTEGDMADIATAMSECENFESLKSIFGTAYKKASDAQKEILQATYAKLKPTLESKQ